MLRISILASFLKVAVAILILKVLSSSSCLAANDRQQIRFDAQPPMLASSQKSSQRYRQLMQHFKKWQHTPYRYGGLSRRGIDCSGFVHLTFRELYKLSIPRTTRELVRQGSYRHPNRLQVGDLVFFKIDSGKRHVGIYVGDRKFLHASTSKGVTISSLNEKYWSKRYHLARQILSSTI